MDEAQVDQADVHERVVGPAHRQATIAMEPRIRSLHEPSMAITTQPAAIITRRFDPIAAMPNVMANSTPSVRQFCVRFVPIGPIISFETILIVVAPL